MKSLDSYKLLSVFIHSITQILYYTLQCQLLSVLLFVKQSTKYILTTNQAFLRSYQMGGAKHFFIIWNFIPLVKIHNA